jgi:hypothetical protein
MWAAEKMEIRYKMVFGGTNCSFRRVGAMVKERDVLVLEGEVDREEERGEVRRGVVVKKKVDKGCER